MTFHAGLPPFSAGFLGVDIFFVISGFLITTIIASEIDEHRFSIVAFYERRARRILPALFFVVAACLPFAYFWMVPGELIAFAKSLIAVATFSSNFYFWRSTGYFDVSAEQSPLLHIWSLAVEEQFYVLFPLALLFATRVSRRMVLPSVVAVALLSLGLSEFCSRHFFLANFYLAPTRAWELMGGAILALVTLRRGVAAEPAAKWLAEMLSSLAMAAILASLVLFDRSTRLPSLLAVPTVIGTVLLIAFADQRTIVGRVLAMRPLRLVGLISYSAYLWHQPLLAFARIRYQQDPPPWLLIVLLTGALIMAYVSWRFIERPFRHKRCYTRRQIFAFSAGGTVLLITVGAAVVAARGIPARTNFSPELQRSFELSPRASACHDIPQAETRSTGWYCPVVPSKSENDVSYVLAGDSHALALLPAFETASARLRMNGLYITTSACPPLLGVKQLDGLGGGPLPCPVSSERIFRLVQQRGIRDVFLVSRWTVYVERGYPTHRFPFKPMARTATSELSYTESRRAFEIGLWETARRYARIGVRLHIILQAPNQLVDPQRLYFYSSSGGRFNPADLLRASVKLRDHRTLQAWVNGRFAQVAARMPTVSLISLDPYLCDSRVCPIGTPRASFYSDENHLGLAGAQRVEPAIEQVLTKLGRSTEPDRKLSTTF